MARFINSFIAQNIALTNGTTITSANITTVNGNVIESVTINGNTFTRNMDQVNPISLLSSSFNVSGNTTTSSSSPYLNNSSATWVTGGMGNYAITNYDSTPSHSGTGTGSVAATASLNSAGYLRVSVNAHGGFGTYTGNVPININSTGYCMTNSNHTLANRTMPTANINIPFNIRWRICLHSLPAEREGL